MCVWVLAGRQTHARTHARTHTHTHTHTHIHTYTHTGGDTVYKQREIGNSMYMLANGTVELDPLSTASIERGVSSARVLYMCKNHTRTYAQIHIHTHTHAYIHRQADMLSLYTHAHARTGHMTLPSDDEHWQRFVSSPGSKALAAESAQAAGGHTATVKVGTEG